MAKDASQKKKKRKVFLIPKKLNNRRVQLINKYIAGTISPKEKVELDKLQKEVERILDPLMEESMRWLRRLRRRLEKQHRAK